jgi:ACS family hexuronate transporter-like MFS transporter
MKLKNLRWVIVGMLLAISIKNYIDRQMFSILAPTIQADLSMSDAEYGQIVSYFLAAYTVAYLLSGRLVDAIGARIGLGLSLALWSLSSALTGLARSTGAVAACRVGLGLGEAGGYTASPKVVTEWFPDRERGTATSIYAIGASVGATIAPLLVIFLANRYGWRGTFVVSGLIGLLVVVPWLILFRPLTNHPWVTDAEKAHILDGQVAVTAEEAAPLTEKARWLAIIGSPKIWALMGARMLTDPVWYFLQFWMPKYLHSERALTQGQLTTVWLIFLAADLGFIGGGFLSDRLVRRGRIPADARRWVMGVAALTIPVFVPWIPLFSGIELVFAFSMVVALAHAAWLTCSATLVMDLVSKPLFSTAFGFVSAGSAVGGIVMNSAVAWTISRYSYDGCFYAMVLLHPLAMLLILRFTRNRSTPI